MQPVALLAVFQFIQGANQLVAFQLGGSPARNRIWNYQTAIAVRNSFHLPYPRCESSNHLFDFGLGNSDAALGVGELFKALHEC